MIDSRVEHKDRKELLGVGKALLDEVRQIAYDLHVYLGSGLLEKVYENGLRHRLELAGHKVEAQKPLMVFDQDGTVLLINFGSFKFECRSVIRNSPTPTPSL